MLSLFETIWLLKPTCLVTKATRPWINTSLLVRASRPWRSSLCWWRQRNSWRYSLSTAETEEESKKVVRWQYSLCKHKALFYLTQWGWKTIEYPRSWRSSVALYCVGISINADNANSASFLSAAMLFDIISVKFTNCMKIKYSFTSQLLRTRKTANG